jgi:hypothetical protein
LGSTGRAIPFEHTDPSKREAAVAFSACPIATVDAPIDQVWSLLANPAQYASWWDAQTRSIVPEGPAQPGQQVFAQTTALGIRWGVHSLVQAVAPEKCQLDLLTRLPFGITVRNHITCARLDDRHTRVGFG